MTARTMFRASIAVGEREVPVRMYAAAQDARIHFRLLHAEDLQPVEQTMVDPRTDEPVDAVSMQRGIEVEPGVFVAFTKEELDQLAPATERTMEVEGFLDRDTVDPAWFDRPYYLGPDGPDAEYAAFATALANRHRVAIVRFAMRKKNYVGAVLAEGGNLVLMTLHPAEDIAIASRLEEDEGARKSVDPKQVALAEQLIATLEADFDPAAYEDEHRARLEALLERKREGKPIPRPRRGKAPAPADDLADALRKSLHHAKEKRSA